MQAVSASLAGRPAWREPLVEGRGRAGFQRTAVTVAMYRAVRTRAAAAGDGAAAAPSCRCRG